MVLVFYGVGAVGFKRWEDNPKLITFHDTAKAFIDMGIDK